MRACETPIKIIALALNTEKTSSAAYMLRHGSPKPNVFATTLACCDVAAATICVTLAFATEGRR